jgi:hypothetical protein
MKNFNSLLFLVAILTFGFTTQSNAQCEDWIAPSPTTGWIDFNLNFGGAPSDDGSGCPFNEIQDFEVFASEAYNVENFVAGTTYSFSMCNGPGAGTWVPDFTIIAPSGAIDAFGAGDGDGCTITWTASESGTYLIVINEEGECGGGPNTGTANGYPALTCTASGTPCEDWVNPSPTSGWTDFNSTFGGAPCDDGTGCPFNEIDAFEVFASEAYSIDNFIMGGTYSFSMCNGPGAGTWVPEFTIIAPSGAIDAFGPGDGDGCTITWTCSEEGTYLIVINEAGECGGGPNTGTGSGYPALTCIADAPCVPVACEAGVMTTTGEVSVCPGETVNVATDGSESVPAGGGFGWYFDNVLGGTGALEGAFIFLDQPNDIDYDSDLNGVLSANSLPLFEGLWVIKSATYTNPDDAFNSICSFSADSIVVNFANDAPTVDDVVDNGDGSATAMVSGGAPPYTYEWSDGQTTETAVGLTTGDYTVVVTDANGCVAEGDVSVVFTSVGNIQGLEFFQVGPNPTSGLLSIQLELAAPQDVVMQLVDVTGKTITTNARRNILTDSYELDLSDQPNGIYFLRLMIGEQALTERIMVLK